MLMTDQGYGAEYGAAALAFIKEKLSSTTVATTTTGVIVVSLF